MKKTIALLSAVAMLATAGLTMTNVSAVSESDAKFDLNGDGAVNIYDVKYVLHFYGASSVAYMKDNNISSITDIDKDALKTYTLEKDNISEEDYLKFDLNGDGYVDPKDGTYLIVNTGIDITDDNSKDKEYTKKFDNLFGIEYVEYVVPTENPVRVGDMNGDRILDSRDQELYDKYKPGDVDGDGTVDAKDATMVLSNYADLIAKTVSNKASYGSTSFVINSDANGDGNVDAKDATVILTDYANSIYEQN